MYSTPINDKIDFQTYLHNEASDNTQFLLEQTISFQEEISDRIEEIIDSITANSLNNSMNYAMVRTESNCATVNDDNSKSSTFEGFGDPEGSKETQNKLNEIKRLLAFGRKHLDDSRNRSVDFRRRIWQYREQKSFTIDQSDYSGVFGEASDVISQLPTQRRLRSAGSAREYPHVQQKTLEYRSRRSNL